MYLHAPPGLIRGMLRHAIWRIKTEKKELYLTFDDGPTPGITELVLDILHHYNAKATFFCLGKNADAAPALFQQIRDEQHTVGN
ncbi:MAG: polysaccharide deacetylase family protein, partial [Flavobacteriales bacterium]